MLDLTGYDFLDFGSGFGGCVHFAIKRLGGKKGLCIEKNSKRCGYLRRKGYKCLNSNILNVNFPPKSVNFVTISHLLEHLPNKVAVRKVLKKAITTAKDFVFIEGPSFDFDKYLARNDLKFLWRDGHGHKTKVEVKYILRWAKKFGVTQYTLKTERPYIKDSFSDDIHPLSSPPDVKKYNPKQYPPKHFVEFTKKIYRSFVLFLWLNKNIDKNKYLNTRKAFEIEL